MKKVALSLVIASLISGCGGSGSSSSGPSDSEPLGSSTPDANIVAISGVYDSSRTDDESYLYISTSGAVTAYDYQNDASGGGGNCYSVASDISQTNYSLTSGLVTYSTATEEYTLTSAPNVLVFTYDTINGMQNFLLNSSFSSVAGLDISLPSVNVKVGGAGSLQSTLLISDIEALLCT